MSEPTFAPLLGWMRGPDYKQRFRGWVVLAERESGEDWPVTIIAGHNRPPTSDSISTKSDAGPISQLSEQAEKP